MTMTPEQAAKMIVGKYNIMSVVWPADFLRWGSDPVDFHRQLGECGITPCKTCGAYRRADSCQICDEAGKVVKE